MHYFIQIDDGPELVIKHVDQLSFASGSLREAYQRIQRAVDQDAIVPSVLRVLAMEIDEVTHADLRELQAVVDIDTTEASQQEIVATTVEQTVATVGRWQRSQSTSRSPSHQ